MSSRASCRARLAVYLAVLSSFPSAVNALGPIAGQSCPGFIPPSVIPSFSAGRCQLLDGSPGGVSMWIMCNQQFAMLVGGLACLIGAERQSRGLPALSSNDALMSSAFDHALDAGRLKWWTRGANPHVNPQTGSTVESRIKAKGYCGGNPSLVSEITYTGTGDQFAAPINAVDWWMNVSTFGHREAILDPSIKEIGIGIMSEGADGSAPPHALTGTYVITFGACQ